MEINSDFAKRAVMHGRDMDWVPSPTAGVERKMLDRIGDEVARATSIVRYAPGSAFPAHVHGGGEEYFVLDGVFQDEGGDHPEGTYVRNPPGSRHTPASAPGCTIFVKLWQFDPADRTPVRIDTGADSEANVADGAADGTAGVDSRELFRDARETVRLLRCAPGAAISVQPVGGYEVFVLGGDFISGVEAFRPWSWLRLPIGSGFTAMAGPNGCRLLTKEGHLRFADAAAPGTT